MRRLAFVKTRTDHPARTALALHAPTVRATARLPARLGGVALALAALALAGCGGGGSGGGDATIGTGTGSAGTPGDTGGTGTDTGTGSSVVTDVNSGSDAGTGGGPASPEADIARYGVVAVGDEDGEESGIALASFSRLSESVAPGAFGVSLDPAQAPCTIERDDGLPQYLTTPLYLPTPIGVGRESIGAGDSVLLSSAAGTWIELQGRPSDQFYTRPSADAAPTGPVPSGLVADITGDEFPAFRGAALPDVEPLVGLAYAGGDTVSRDTRFTWTPSAATGTDTRVRIETASAASFFEEDGVSVSCLVPDTGEFVFSPDARAALGGDFAGEAPDFSRVAFDSVREGDALLVLVRESFVVAP